MNTQGIGNSDSWAQFMKLAAEARTRNQGLNSVKTKQQVENTSMFKGSVARNYMNNAAVNTPRAATAAGRIVGGLFDAYA